MPAVCGRVDSLRRLSTRGRFSGRTHSFRVDTARRDSGPDHSARVACARAPNELAWAVHTSGLCWRVYSVGVKPSLGIEPTTSGSAVQHLNHSARPSGFSLRCSSCPPVPVCWRVDGRPHDLTPAVCIVRTSRPAWCSRGCARSPRRSAQRAVHTPSRLGSCVPGVHTRGNPAPSSTSPSMHA